MIHGSTAKAGAEVAQRTLDSRRQDLMVLGMEFAALLKVATRISYGAASRPPSLELSTAIDDILSTSFWWTFR
jgi:hypothetical protein